jgi:predicted PurR-regulated permease PerM
VVAALALAVALPLGFASAQAAAQVAGAFDWAKSVADRPLPEMPQWISDLPAVGAWAKSAWASFSREGGPALMEASKAHAAQAASVVGTLAGKLGSGALEAVMSLAVAGACMAWSRELEVEIRAAGAQLMGDGSEDWIALAASCARGVAMGVCGTALVLSVCVWLGLAFAGIEAASLLACLCMALCLAQIGPLPILLPVCLWLGVEGSYVSAGSLAALAAVLSVVDGVLRPYLIGREVKMPMALIFAGVVGGLIAWGMMGLFAGPMALAMGRKLWSDWRAQATDGEAKKG